MIKTKEKAERCQLRRQAQGKKGLAGAVKRYLNRTKQHWVLEDWVTN